MKEPHSAHDTERLRSLLTQSRPANGGAPDADRIAAHERRGRRRRVALSTLLALAVAAFIITPQLLNKTRTTNLRNDLANRLAASSQSTDPRTTTPCPADLVALPGDFADGVVRVDASSLRLCLAKASGSTGASGGLLPADALLLDSGSTFLADVARSPEVSANHCLTAPSRPDGYAPSSPEAYPPSRPDAYAPSSTEAYVLLVGYPDGSVQRIYLGSGCDEITVAGVRHDASGVLALFRSAVAAQP